jgi:septum formation inhibitor-activating ATPase MinD
VAARLVLVENLEDETGNRAIGRLREAKDCDRIILDVGLRALDIASGCKEVIIVEVIDEDER